MFTINKTLIATAAVVAFGLVAVIDIAQSRTEPTASQTVAARFPVKAEMMAAVNLTEPTEETRKGDKGMMPAEGCTREHWPYIADECLHATDGERRKPPARTIPIGRRGEPVHLASR